MKVVVIGGGIVGLSSAYYLAKDGHQVTVVDRSTATTFGCSHGNAGMIVPSHFIPLAAPGMIQMGLRMLPNRKSPFGFRLLPSRSLAQWIFQFMVAANPRHVSRCAPILRDLNLAARRSYEELATEIGQGLGFEKRGLLMLCRDADTLEHEAAVARQANEMGLHARVLDPAGLAAADPDVTMSAAGAIHFEDDCHLSPHDLMTRLRASLVASGVEFRDGCVTESFDVKSSNIEAIRTSQGEVVGDQFVLATGSWSEAMAKKLGLRLPVQPGKGYSMTLESPVELPRLCSIFTEARVAVTPMNGALRFAGTMEIGAPEEGVNQQRVDGIIESIPAFFPKFRADQFVNQPVWSGLRPCSPDGMPYVGRTGVCRNLTVATGHAMMGLSLAPITGKLVAEIVGDRPASIPLALMNPDRFNR